VVFKTPQKTLFEFYYATQASFKEKEILRPKNKIGDKNLEKQSFIDLFKDFQPANVDVEELLKHIEIDVTCYLIHRVQISTRGFDSEHSMQLEVAI
jgi:hypothetical protein